MLHRKSKYVCLLFLEAEVSGCGSFIEMAALYRKAMKTVFENLPEDTALQDIHPICIMKLLMHFWLVTDIKAKLIRDADDTETEAIPDNWYRSDEGIDLFYSRNGWRYGVCFPRPFPERNDCRIHFYNEEAADFEMLCIYGNSPLPGNCSEDRARVDEEQIKKIIIEFVTRLRPYIEKIQSGNFRRRDTFDP